MNATRALGVLRRQPSVWLNETRALGVLRRQPSVWLNATRLPFSGFPLYVSASHDSRWQIYGSSISSAPVYASPLQLTEKEKRVFKIMNPLKAYHLEIQLNFSISNTKVNMPNMPRSMIPRKYQSPFLYYFTASFSGNFTYLQESLKGVTLRHLFHTSATFTNKSFISKGGPCMKQVPVV